MMVRPPSALPIILLLLFVGVLAERLNVGLGGAARGGAYIDYILTGILVMTNG